MLFCFFLRRFRFLLSDGFQRRFTLPDSFRRRFTLPCGFLYRNRFLHNDRFGRGVRILCCLYRNEYSFDLPYHGFGFLMIQSGSFFQPCEGPGQILFRPLPAGIHRAAPVQGFGTTFPGCSLVPVQRPRKVFPVTARPCLIHHLRNRKKRLQL